MKIIKVVLRDDAVFEFTNVSKAFETSSGSLLIEMEDPGIANGKHFVRTFADGVWAWFDRPPYKGVEGSTTEEREELS